MAREWSLQETRALVEEHIALKEEEKLESRTASEHWNKVAKKLREKGSFRSYKSCNKRWYRLEQYEVQIFSFNMEEGKDKNYWDLTRAERVEFREKWPQLPSGDGIDKEMFDLLKKFSHQYEKKEKVESSNSSTTGVDTKEVVYSKSNTKITRQTVPPPPPILATPQSTTTPRILSRTTMATGEELLKQQQNEECQKKSKHNWPATTTAAIETQPPAPPPSMSSHAGALDGFKLQAREHRKRRAAEFRKNNRTVPYNSTHTTFTKTTPPFLPIPPTNAAITTTTATTTATIATPEITTFGSITTIPSQNNTTIIFDENPLQNLPKAQTKPPIQFKRLFHSSPKLDSTPMPQNPMQAAEKPILSAKQMFEKHVSEKQASENRMSEEKKNCSSYCSFSVPQQQQQQPIGNRLNFLNEKPLSDRKHLLTSINSHLPLLQPRDHHFGNNNNSNNSNSNNSNISNNSNSRGVNLDESRDRFSLGSLDEQLQVILGLQPTSEDQKATDGQPFGGRNGSLNVESLVSSSAAGLVSVAIAGLGVQLSTIVKLLQAEHAAEQEVRNKMIQFVEFTMKSLANHASSK